MKRKTGPLMMKLATKAPGFVKTAKAILSQTMLKRLGKPIWKPWTLMKFRNGQLSGCKPTVLKCLAKAGQVW